MRTLPRLTSGRAGRFARTEMFQLAVEVAAAELSSRGEPTDVVDRLRPPPAAHHPHAHAPAPRRDRVHDGGRGRR